MILVIANHECNERTGRLTLVTSHGVDIDSGDTLLCRKCTPGPWALCSTRTSASTY